MTMPSPRLRIALTFLTGATFAACSSGHSNPGSARATNAPNANPAVAIVNATAAKTFAQKTAQVDIAFSVSGGPHVSISGPFDLTTGTGQLALNVSGVNIQGTFPNPSNLLYANGNLYLSASGIVTSFDNGKPWAQITPATMQSILCVMEPGANSPGIAQMATGNPGNLLDALDTSAMTVTPGGTSVSNGVAVTNYDVVVNPVEAEKVATGEAKALFEVMAPNGTAAPLTVGIDASGVLRSLSATFTAGGSPAQLSLTLAGFGTPVNASAPPPAQVGQLQFPGGCPTTTTR